MFGLEKRGCVLGCVYLLLSLSLVLDILGGEPVSCSSGERYGLESLLRPDVELGFEYSQWRYHRS